MRKPPLNKRVNSADWGKIGRFKKELELCRAGTDWEKFEHLCADIIEFLFIPALSFPQRQVRSHLGTGVVDLIMANRHISDVHSIDNKNWYLLFIEARARYIPFEFKCYNMDIGREEISQLASYMNKYRGKLAIMVSNKAPSHMAKKERDSQYVGHGKKAILFLTTDHLKIMLDMKAAGEDPSDLIVDLWDEFKSGLI